MFEESVMTNTNNMLNELFMFPYILNDNINIQLVIFCNYYMKNYENFISYFKKQWFYFFINGLYLYFLLVKKRKIIEMII